LETPHPTPFDDAALYDLLFTDFDYGLAFYLEQAKNAQGAVLDLCCGTGRILLPLLQAGVDADGVDGFPAMLDAARRKALAAGFEPRLFLQDMRAFRTDRRYALIVIPFNSFIHNLTAADQVATLCTCREHLLPGGKLVFDVFFPGPDYRSQPRDEPDLELERALPDTGNRLQAYDLRTLDQVEQLQHSENEIRELSPTGDVVRVHKTQTTIRWIYKQEMALLLTLAGFARWEISRAFDGEPLTGATEPMLVKAWHS
jgi:SAM-dependent methyltransferase